jgi:hypothetical protein
LVDGLLPISDLVKLHQKEADILRERAGEEPQPTVPVIRQNRRGTHCGLRARRAFIDLMAEEIDLWTQGNAPVGFDRVEAIVAFTRIGFPEADADVVRKTLEPTTREGRRQWRADAHKRKPGPPGTELPGFADGRRLENRVHGCAHPVGAQTFGCAEQGSESGLTNQLCAERAASLWLQAGSARLGCRAFLGSVIVLGGMVPPGKNQVVQFQGAALTRVRSPGAQSRAQAATTRRDSTMRLEQRRKARPCAPRWPDRSRARCRALIGRPRGGMG